MQKLRKISDVWKAVYEKRTNIEIKEIEWKQSYEGVRAAIEYVGLTLITTKEELDAMEIPVDKNRHNYKKYNDRKIKVSKNGIIRESTICSLLNGGSSLKTDEEMLEIRKKVGFNNSSVLPKGISTTNNLETKTINELDTIINISSYAQRKHITEHRLYDIAYCLINDNIDNKVFVADQIKSSKVNNRGRIQFSGKNSSLTINQMISILENGSLTCIGKNQDNKIDVVWFFYGTNIINILNKFDMSQKFTSTLHLTRNSNNKFTLAMNDPLFRFDVGKSSTECQRLLAKKIDFIKNGPKYSLIFLNEDDSQIPCANHKIEQNSFNMTRLICKNINVVVEKRHEDSYGPIDFIVNGSARVQDKVATNIFHVRHDCRLPYNPDTIDIFQISDLINKIVYTIPMRVIKNDIITSFFTSEQLMKNTIRFSLKWKKTHKQFKHDFKTNEGAISYVNFCDSASKIPQLTDRNFYTNMINENKEKFCSKKQLAEYKKNILN